MKRASIDRGRDGTKCPVVVARTVIPSGDTPDGITVPKAHPDIPGCVLPRGAPIPLGVSSRNGAPDGVGGAMLRGAMPWNAKPEARVGVLHPSQRAEGAPAPGSGARWRGPVNPDWTEVQRGIARALRALVEAGRVAAPEPARPAAPPVVAAPPALPPAGVILHHDGTRTVVTVATPPKPRKPRKGRVNAPAGWTFHGRTGSGAIVEPINATPGNGVALRWRGTEAAPDTRPRRAAPGSGAAVDAAVFRATLDASLATIAADASRDASARNEAARRAGFLRAYGYAPAKGAWVLYPDGSCGVCASHACRNAWGKGRCDRAPALPSAESLRAALSPAPGAATGRIDAYAARLRRDKRADVPRVNRDVVEDYLSRVGAL